MVDEIGTNRTDSTENLDGVGPDFGRLISAREALERIAATHNSYTVGKLEMADGLRDGRINAWASAGWDSRKRRVVDAWSEEPDPDDPKFDYMVGFRVSRGIWQRSPAWLEEQSDWRWPPGNFSVTGRGDRYIRYMFEDVHFDPQEVDNLACFTKVPNATEDGANGISIGIEMG